MKKETFSCHKVTPVFKVGMSSRCDLILPCPHTRGYPFPVCSALEQPQKRGWELQCKLDLWASSVAGHHSAPLSLPVGECSLSFSSPISLCQFLIHCALLLSVRLRFEFDPLERHSRCEQPSGGCREMRHQVDASVSTSTPLIVYRVVGVALFGLLLEVHSQ